MTDGAVPEDPSPGKSMCRSGIWGAPLRPVTAFVPQREPVRLTNLEVPLDAPANTRIIDLRTIGA